MVSFETFSWFNSNRYNWFIFDLSDNCSHNKAWKYFAQGVDNQRFFTAMRCDSFTDYMTGRCDPKQMPGKMGFFAETT